jgi:hypothetical protein
VIHLLRLCEIDRFLGREVKRENLESIQEEDRL